MSRGHEVKTYTVMFIKGDVYQNLPDSILSNFLPKKVNLVPPWLIFIAGIANFSLDLTDVQQ